MANEAILRNRMSDPIDWIVLDGNGIEKGTVMKMSGDRTAYAATADADKFAGIAAREKIADDGRTRLALFYDGIFDMKSTADAIAVGAPVKISGTNLIAAADDDTIENSAEVIGTALEAASGGEVIQVHVGRH